MTPARQRRQRSAWMTDADLTPIPYLGTGLVTAEPVKAGAVRQFRRPEGRDLLGFQHARTVCDEVSQVAGVRTVDRLRPRIHQ